MTPTDYVSEFVYEKYIWPALERGDKIVTIDTRQIHDALDAAYSQSFIGAVLGSMHFRNTYRVSLESAEFAGTETYTFRLDVGRAMLT